MKKIKWIFNAATAIALVTVLAACGKHSAQTGEKLSIQESQPDTSATVNGNQTDQGPDRELQTQSDDVMVIYFSATGTTKNVAEKIAELTGAGLYEIIPEIPYTNADLDYNDDQSRTSVEMSDPDSRPNIGSDSIDFEGCSTIYLGYPIWWGEAPRIMSTFVETYDFDGITVIPFCTSGSSGIGGSGSHIAELAGSGNWLPGQRFDGDVSEEELNEWINGL